MSKQEKASKLKFTLQLDELALYFHKQLKEDALLYLEKRGITEETAQLFQIGYDAGKIGFVVSQNPLGDYFENRVILPVRNEHGNVIDLIGRTLDLKEPRYKSLMGNEEAFFHVKALQESDDVVLCNGIFDVLTLAQENFPAICVPNPAVFKDQHAQQLKDKRVFICLGNDDFGRRESMRIQSMLEEVASETYIVSLPENVRDINDLFVRGQNPGEVFVELVNKALEEHLTQPVAPDLRNMTVFNEEYLKRHRGQFFIAKTGISELDELFSGGFGTGLHVLAGHASSGVQHLMKQMADHFCEQDIPVIYLTWNLSNYECWARSIARILHVSPILVLNGKLEPEEINRANHQYLNIGKHHWTVECELNTTFERVASTIERIALNVGRTPIILMDQLANIAPISGQAVSYPQHIAMLSYALKQASREWNCPILASISLEAGQVQLPSGLETAADSVLHFTKQSTGADVSSIAVHAIKNQYGRLGSLMLHYSEDLLLFS